jgi:hypothetical protein
LQKPEGKQHLGLFGERLYEHRHSVKPPAAGRSTVPRICPEPAYYGWGGLRKNPHNYCPNIISDPIGPGRLPNFDDDVYQPGGSGNENPLEI